MGYVFRPGKALTDQVAEAVRDLQHDLPRLNVSAFFEFAINEALNAARMRRAQVIRELNAFYQRQLDVE